MIDGCIRRLKVGALFFGGKLRIVTQEYIKSAYFLMRRKFTLFAKIYTHKFSFGGRLYIM